MLNEIGSDDLTLASLFGRHVNRSQRSYRSARSQTSGYSIRIFKPALRKDTRSQIIDGIDRSIRYDRRIVASRIIVGEEHKKLQRSVFRTFLYHRSRHHRIVDVYRSLARNASVPMTFLEIISHADTQADIRIPPFAVFSVRLQGNAVEIRRCHGDEARRYLPKR